MAKCQVGCNCVAPEALHNARAEMTDTPAETFCYPELPARIIRQGGDTLRGGRGFSRQFRRAVARLSGNPTAAAASVHPTYFTIVPTAVFGFRTAA